jgi:hypothetical protein
MSTLAAALAKQTRRPSVRCSIAVLYETLDDIDTKALRNAMNDVMVTASSIYRALVDEGHDVGLSALGRHRRGDCHCDAL